MRDVQHVSDTHLGASHMRVLVSFAKPSHWPGGTFSVPEVCPKPGCALPGPRGGCLQAWRVLRGPRTEQ